MHNGLLTLWIMSNLVDFPKIRSRLRSIRPMDDSDKVHSDLMRQAARGLGRSDRDPAALSLAWM
jgi:hypothetical protein